MDIDQKTILEIIKYLENHPLYIIAIMLMIWWNREAIAFYGPQLVLIAMKKRTLEDLKTAHPQASHGFEWGRYANLPANLIVKDCRNLRAKLIRSIACSRNAGEPITFNFSNVKKINDQAIKAWRLTLEILMTKYDDTIVKLIFPTPGINSSLDELQKWVECKRKAYNAQGLIIANDKNGDS